MITLEILKENRQDLIDEITDEYGAENLKVVMSELAAAIGKDGYNNASLNQFYNSVTLKSDACFQIKHRKATEAQDFIEQYNKSFARRHLLQY